MTRAHRPRHGTDDRCQTSRRDPEQATICAGMEDYVQRIVDTAPPLTADQQDRLAALLDAGAPLSRRAGYRNRRQAR
jgi:hypothetical protein